MDYLYPISIRIIQIIAIPIIVLIIAWTSLKKDKRGKLKWCFIVALILQISLGVLLHINDQRKITLRQEQIDQVQLRLRVLINSHNFEAFNSNPKIRDKLIRGTYLKWESFNEKNTGYPMYVHELMKREDIREQIKEYIFNNWKLRLYCESKDGKSWIENEVKGSQDIDRIDLLSTDYKDNIYYYMIGIEYKFDIKDHHFKTLKGYDGANCEITLEVPESYRAFEYQENILRGSEFIHLHLIGPHQMFLDKAQFKCEINKPLAYGRRVIIGEIKIPETFYENYNNI